MPKVTRVISHLSKESIRKKFRKSPDADKRMRWQIIYTICADPRDGSLVAKQLGCGRALVSNAVREYNALGEGAFNGPGSGSNRSNSHMSESEEREFLSQFVNRGRRGLVCTISSIKQAYEKKG